jgi:hypothetical protein
VGTKRKRKRQYLYLSVAGLIFCIISACAPVKQLFVQRGACSYLQRVDGYLSRGDFEKAMKESQDVLLLSPSSPPGDAALMAMGLINVHYANPKRDYNKALGYFMRIEKEFPGSSLAEEARIWTGVLQSFEKAKQVDIEIEGKKKELEKK